jgi:glycosyltransferase involved in cell wall biosynthesis
MRADLPEVVLHTKTGVVTEANNRDSLAWGILEVLKNPGYARWLVDNAYEDLERRFSWQKLAMETQWVYDRVVEERAEVDW